MYAPMRHTIHPNRIMQALILVGCSAMIPDTNQNMAVTIMTNVIVKYKFFINQIPPLFQQLLLMPPICL
jgi:hypothetical protein